MQQKKSKTNNSVKALNSGGSHNSNKTRERKKDEVRARNSCLEKCNPNNSKRTAQATRLKKTQCTKENQKQNFTARVCILFVRGNG